jgi:hypothetical protein
MVKDNSDLEISQWPYYTKIQDHIETVFQAGTSTYTANV